MNSGRYWAPRRRALVALMLAGGLTLSACTAPQTQQSAASASASESSSESPSAEESAATSGDVEAISPVEGLQLSLPVDYSGGQPADLGNGVQQLKYYVGDTAAPVAVVIEYVSDGSLKADQVVATETEAFASDNIAVETVPVEVPGGSGGQLMTWSGEAEAPWTESGVTTNLDCSAVLVNGPTTYYYGVFVCAEGASEEAVAAKDQIIISVSVSQP